MSRFSFVISAVAATVLLSGCAHKVWEKPGANQSDYNKDSYQCERDARQSGYYGQGLAGALAMQDFYDRCMVSKDWTARMERRS